MKHTSSLSHIALWFSIIEVLIGMFIFTLGLISIYAILASTLSINERNKNALIASHLAREQIEIVRNIRDTNYTNLQVWNKYSDTKSFQVDTYYALENDIRSGSDAYYNTQVLEIPYTGDFPEWIEDIMDMESYRLCMTPENAYTYDCSSWNKKTQFYRYFLLRQAYDGTTPLNGAYEAISKVIWVTHWYHEFDIRTVVTDWRRI